MSNLKTYLNFYWSVRKYLYDNFPTTPIYYNPLTKPSVSADKTLILYLREDSISRLTVADPRSICVAKNDPESIKIAELVSAVVEKFASSASALKSISFYDYASKAIIGYIRVRDIRNRPALIYSEGYIQKAVDMTMDYVVEQRHVFA